MSVFDLGGLQGRRRRRQGHDADPLGPGRRRMDRGRRPAARRCDRPGPGPPGCRAVQAGRVPALVHLGLGAPARLRRRPGLAARMAGRCWPGTLAADDRRRLDPLPRPTGWPSRARPGSTGTASAATTRWWPVLAGAGVVLHTRLREGVANSGRGAGQFRGRGDHPGAPGRGERADHSLRADSGFYNHKVIDACRKAGVACSVTIKLTKAVHKVIAQIPNSPGHRSPTGWTAALTSPRTGSGPLAAREGSCA